ncbi:MAG: carboxy-S-adenosyl-L-methionine synthase CmoA [Chloroflexota bacterium]
MSTDPNRLYLLSDKDDLYANGPWPKPFEFNAEVARVFDDMVSRSVPLYREVMVAAAQWTRAYYQSGTAIVDVGCSTGTFLELMGRILTESATLIGIDNSAHMLEKAAEKLAPLTTQHQVQWLCQDAIHSSFEQSSVVVMNYTLQFLSLGDRQKLLTHAYEGLVPGGLLFLSEKVRSAIPQFQETITRHYEAFKEHNGYAQSEIERKKEALEQVLTPLTVDEQFDMLGQAGFMQIDTLIKMHNFTTFVALK